SLITFIAAILALVLSMLLIPYFNNITGKQFMPSALLQPLPIIAVIMCAVRVSFFAGIYPALILSGTQIMGVLKKGFTFTGGNNLLRKIFIIVQFCIFVIILLYTIIITE